MKEQLDLFGDPEPMPEFSSTGRPLRSSAKARRRLAKYRKENKEHLTAYAKAYWSEPSRRDSMFARHDASYAVPKNRFRIFLRNAKRRAAEKGLPFDDDLLEKIEAMPHTHCVCCGREFDYTAKRLHKKKETSPSIDRFDNSKGYTADNIRIICHRCNELKSDATVPELLTVIAYLKRGPDAV